VLYLRLTSHRKPIESRHSHDAKKVSFVQEIVNKEKNSSSDEITMVSAQPEKKRIKATLQVPLKKRPAQGHRSP
jgi:hypothetical protein